MWTLAVATLLNCTTVSGPDQSVKVVKAEDGRILLQEYTMNYKELERELSASDWNKKSFLLSDNETKMVFDNGEWIVVEPVEQGGMGGLSPAQCD
jgi:hypothetical protein